MIRCKKENIEWLEFEILREFPEVVHGVFLRHGGLSKDPYGSLNMGGGTGDKEDRIAENRRLITQILGIDRLISAKQVHGTHLESIPNSSGLLDEGCDGLLTEDRGVGLLIKHADCQAAIFYDPIKEVIANIHCGWRGNVQNIYEKTVTALKQKHGSNPSDLIVCISPSLGPNHAEFIHYKKEFPESFFPFERKTEHFNLWEIAKMQLTESGILEDHIEIAQICTMQEKKDFFSYRRDKKTGRHGTVVALKHANPVSQKKRTS